MDDTLSCPICRAKLNNSAHSKGYLSFLRKSGDFVNRTCQSAPLNHTLWFLADKKTGQVDLLHFSLPATQGRYVQINYPRGTSRIYCYKNGDPSHIEIDRRLQPDFPSLEKIKRVVSTLVLFS